MTKKVKKMFIKCLKVFNSRKCARGRICCNEQAFEMMHSKFASYTQHRLPNPEHPAYGAALLKVTKEINVLHSR